MSKATMACRIFFPVFFILTGLMPWSPAWAQPESCNVVWHEPGDGSSASMPAGNGDIGVNVWVEKSGDLVFYISKTDAWGSQVRPEWDNWMKTGGVLMKLGAVRVSIRPSPLKEGAPFIQQLRLKTGEIVVTEGDDAAGTTMRVWVDANHPVIHVEAENRRVVSTTVSLEDWRLGAGDTMVAATGKTGGEMTWYHVNDSAGEQHLAGRVFGATIRAAGFARRDLLTLQAPPARGKKLISIYPLTWAPENSTHANAGNADNVAAWRSALIRQIKQAEKIPADQAWAAHCKWWDQFWGRSHIEIKGDEQAVNTMKGYVLQRYVTACAGRGAYPVKFNGSIFVVDNPHWKEGNRPVPMSADFRAWGGQYWFQNTRAMYWPRLMAGDFDMMLPLFYMYQKMLPGNEAQVRQFYGHPGAYFQETSPFWGGLNYMGPEVRENYTNHYFTPILELSMMMLDYFDYTGDTAFARKTLLPVAADGLLFFARHFGRDSAGRLLLDPDNSIEMFWKVHDPAPDIAALQAVLPRMIALPEGVAPAEQKEEWKKLLSELPPLPVGVDGEGQSVLLPYTGPQTAHAHNLENPELYAIYPYRIYGLHRPDLSLALHSFRQRKFKDKGCWTQDAIQAAMLGLTDDVKVNTAYALTRKEPSLKFPAFWEIGHDYTPDEDNGGNGENALQLMLLQTDGKKILLLPAWPADWDADFKLNAPYRTTVEGKVRQGRLTDLVVTPASRKADVIDMTK